MLLASLGGQFMVDWRARTCTPRCRRRIRGLNMEVCTTLGMLTPEQAAELRTAGLTAYNHNLDTSPGAAGGDRGLEGGGWRAAGLGRAGCCSLADTTTSHTSRCSRHQLPSCPPWRRLEMGALCCLLLQSTTAR